MLVSTMNDVPGRTVQQVVGEVTGLTVRSRNVGAQGANAILAMRYDSDEVGNGYQEIVAYGTAVVLAP